MRPCTVFRKSTGNRRLAPTLKPSLTPLKTAILRHMKIVVTGGAGFIGANFVHYLRQNYPDYQLVVIDKLNQQGNIENLAPVRKDVEFHEFDLVDETKLKPIFKKGVDYVVHFAAETNVDRSIED